MKTIDLRSDTLTLQDANMLNEMLQAQVGDDCYGEDETVIKLEKYVADLFNKEAALFVNSGTLSNQIAIRSLIEPGDEIILDQSYHINFFEAAQTSALSGAALNPRVTLDGILRVEDVIEAVESRARWSSNYAVPRLIVVENTINGHAGKVFPYEELIKLYQYARENSMQLHMDGARLFNACVATGIRPDQYASYTDTVTFCFSKGLGAPFGSMLIGDAKLIAKARKARKWYGGALHQAGYLAAAAHYSLINNLERLSKDHENARILYSKFSRLKSIDVLKPDTNIVIVDISRLCISANAFVKEAELRGVKLLKWTEKQIRFITSLNNTKDEVLKASDIIADIVRRYQPGVEKSCKVYPFKKLGSAS